LENKAHRQDPKWRIRVPAAASRLLLSPERPVPAARLGAPLAWGMNLWLLLVGWPWAAEGAGSLGLSLAAVAPLAAGAALAAVGLPGLAGACLLVAFPLALAGVFAAMAGPTDPSAVALAIGACSMWVYGAAVARALQPPAMTAGSSGAVRIDALAGRARSPRHYALRQRASRVRNLGLGLIVLGAAAIVIAAPYGADPSELQQAYGDDPRHAAVLIAMVAAAIGVGIASVFTTALVRPPSAEDRRPFSPLRTALALTVALGGALTFYIVRGGS